MRSERIIVFIALVILFLVLGFFVQNKPSGQTGEVASPIVGKVTSPAAGSAVSSAASSAGRINYTNLGKELSKNSMVQALPDKTILLLKFYNFNSGERTWEKSYLLKKGEIKETTNQNEGADIILSIHSKYLNELTNENFCSIIQKANKNGDLGFETDLSKTSLAWKFKSMYKYRDCLGV